MAPEPTVHFAPDPGVPDDDPASYLGLPADEARRRATRCGWPHVRTLPHNAVVTLEYVRGRLNLGVRDDVVVRCWHG